jgi:TetR/AcrR family transcriptional regulator, transcriptional repressor for nem operon
MTTDLTDYSAKAIEILDAAERRVRSGGFEAVSYRDLAADVGIKAASVHYHFPQKALLGKALLERYTDRLLAALGPVNLSQLTVADHIQRLCDCYARAVQDEGLICLGCILGASSQNLPAPVAMAVHHFYTQLLNWTQTALGDRADANTLAAHIIGTLQGSMVLAVALKRPELMADAAEQLRQLVAAPTPHPNPPLAPSSRLNGWSSIASESV